MSVGISPQRNETFQTVLILFLKSKREIGDYSSILFARDAVELLFGGNF